MKIKVTIFTILVLALGLNAFSPLFNSDISIANNFHNSIASVASIHSNGYESSLNKAMNELGVRELSINEFHRQMNKMESDLNNLLDKML